MHHVIKINEIKLIPNHFGIANYLYTPEKKINFHLNISFQVRDAMGSFMTNRYAGGNTHMTLKQDLITQAKQRCHELGGNAIVECKMAISRGKFL